MKFFQSRSTPIAFVVWGFFLWLLQNEVASQSFLAQDALVDINDGALIMRQDYLGYYLGNQKIGFSRYVLKEESTESANKSPEKYFLFESDSFLQIQALGLPVSLKTNQSGEVNEDLSLRSFQFSYEASGQSLSVLVNVEKDGLHLTTKSEEDTSDRVVPHTGPVYHTDMLHLIIARQGLEVGKQLSLPVFEAMTMSLGKARIKVLAEEEIALPDGTKANTFKVETDLKGFKSTSWINTKGDIYKEESTVVGITATAVRETKEQAMDMSYVSGEVQNQQKPEIDLVKASRIEVDPPIDDPKSVKHMEIKLIGAEKDDIVIDGTYQSLKSEDGDRLVLDIRKLDYQNLAEKSAKNPETAPYTTADVNLQSFLADDPLIQSSNPQIRQKALDIIQEKKAANRWEASRAIAEWLYANIKKEMRVTIPSAIEVLTSMKGDCNEHSTLFTALARSIGIPAKLCAGIVYHNDGFYYHAWNEVYIEGNWYPIDATLNRIEMDAAHVKLAEGSLDSQTDIIKLIGTLKVELISVES